MASLLTAPRRRRPMCSWTTIAVTAAALVLVASCAGEPGANPASTSAGPGSTVGSSKCAWAVKANKEVNNVAYPDTSATYWATSYSLAPGERLTLKGLFPDARYMSFITYGIGGSALATLTDRDIVPDGGGASPFSGAGGAGGQRYTVELSADAPPGQNRLSVGPAPERGASGTVNSSTSAAGTGTIVSPSARDAALGSGGAGGTIGTVIYRVYVPKSDADPAGGAPLPEVSLASEGSSTPVPTCATPGGGANVEALVNAFGPATDRPAPASPIFIRPGGNGNNLYPNPDNVYIATIVKHEPGQVVVLRGKAPTVPDTRAGQPITGSEQVRFWSLCTNEYRKPYPVSFCKRDDETKLDADGSFTFVISTPDDRPANATPENGVTWIDTGSTSVDTLLLFRHMLPAPGFAESATKVAPGALAASTMGAYAPRGAYCARSTFEAGGAAACGL